MDVFKNKQKDTASGERRYASMLDIMTEGCQIIGFDWRYLYINEAAARHGNQAKEKLLGSTVMESYPGIENTEVFKLLQRCMEQREPHSLEEEFNTLDGSKRSFHLTIIPVPEGILITSDDINDKKQIEEDQYKLERQLANAMEMAHLGHWEYDVESDLFTFNDQFYKMYKTSEKEVGGYKMSSGEYTRRFVYPEDNDVVAEEIRRSIETFDTDFNRQLEHRILYADGQIGYIVVRFFIAKDHQGKTVRIYGVNQDITDRKNNETAVRDSNERYEQLAEQSRTYAWEVNEYGLFTYVGPSVEKILGYQPEELVGNLHFYDLHPKDERESFKKPPSRFLVVENIFMGSKTASEQKRVKSYGSARTVFPS